MKALLSDAIDDYLRFRSSQDYSRGTLNQDKQVLKRFLTIVGNVYCHTLNERHVNRHFEEAAKTRKASSLQNDHGVLVRFFKWARHTGRMPVDADPMFGRRQPKAFTHEAYRIHVSDFPRLLQAAGDRDPRDRALTSVLLYTLQRDREVCTLRVGDVDLNGGWITSRIHKSRLEDRMPICEELDHELRTWLTHYAVSIGTDLRPEMVLIPSRAVYPIHGEGGRIVRHDSEYRPMKEIRASGRIVSPILGSIGVPLRNAQGEATNQGAHTIRRSGARALFDRLVDQGYDHALRVVQSMLHHKHMSQTEHYIGVTADRRSRDEIIRGQRMYAIPGDNVIRMTR